MYWTLGWVIFWKEDIGFDWCNLQQKCFILVFSLAILALYPSRKLVLQAGSSCPGSASTDSDLPQRLRQAPLCMDFLAAGQGPGEASYTVSKIFELFLCLWTTYLLIPFHFLTNSVKKISELISKIFLIYLDLNSSEYICNFFWCSYRIFLNNLELFLECSPTLPSG